MLICHNRTASGSIQSFKCQHNQIHKLTPLIQLFYEKLICTAFTFGQIDGKTAMQGA